VTQEREEGVRQEMECDQNEEKRTPAGAEGVQVQQKQALDAQQVAQSDEERKLVAE
jgi:hypothetical protein